MGNGKEEPCEEDEMKEDEMREERTLLSGFFLLFPYPMGPIE
jgi:hypothetical protein